MSSETEPRSEIYEDIIIFSNSAPHRSNQAAVDIEFKLVRAAIDAKWFDESVYGKTVTKIKIIGPVHCTNYEGPDKSHLTLKVSPGAKVAHLYLKPDDGMIATPETTLSEIRWRLQQT
ncbi:hypothetical protein JB92DRAFT_2838559 [Gautieria morchelliformis]|nr:hypothetical protein JB92DRAFT_2838559 [Gautieria morchelliformis]